VDVHQTKEQKPSFVASFIGAASCARNGARLASRGAASNVAPAILSARKVRVFMWVVSPAPHRMPLEI